MGLFNCFTISSRHSSSRSSSADALLDEKRSLDFEVQLDDNHTTTRSPDPPHMVTASRLQRKVQGVQRLKRLRELMKEKKIDAYVVLSSDAHGSEYPGECDKQRQFISGFTGSAGTAIITSTEAHLFTDSRYYVQAKRQLDLDLWTLEKVGISNVKDWPAWLLDVSLGKLPDGSVIGVDSNTIGYSAAKRLLDSFKSTQITLDASPYNLVDQIWGSDRPARLSSKIRIHPLQFTGELSSSKLARLRTWLQQNKTGGGPESFFFVSTLPQIAWLLNLRAKDIAFNPFFYAVVLVPASEEERFKLWIQEGSVTDDLRNYIHELGGEIRSYSDALKEVQGTKKVLSDGSLSWAAFQAIQQSNLTVVPISPIVEWEAIKNDLEIQGFRNAYIRDGVAWAKWASWLEHVVLQKGSKVTEFEAAEQFTRIRSQGEFYEGLGYDNISATGANAALPHYAPSERESKTIELTTPYLNDSGPQYLDATIDCTRTSFLGRHPTAEQKRAFTRVLQGHIAIDQAIFPEGTTGGDLDVLARRMLWSDGMQYSHGTGHGIGEYLGVHEGPQGLASTSTYPLKVGHILSNEPGFYEEGSYGIRIESVLVVKEVKTRREFGDKKWLGFERVTMVPIQSTKLVNYGLLTQDEKKWLKQHNDHIRATLVPLLKGDKRAIDWLKRQ
ncbi:BQ2448_1431 [Microbotryum intermedium]|uniref:BQ2448_1431 protein n=1 Tax=Microbotryum intermedium TaxID=269621 RepID=A0A238FA35_9BASI|nr:BQ2448_1431 [Microbotryum intermedium]